MTSLFIFRRDFRIIDNTAFIECYKKSNKILPIFIFTPSQIENNEYFSHNSFQFLIESLDELNNELKKIIIHKYIFIMVKILKLLRIFTKIMILIVYILIWIIHLMLFIETILLKIFV